MLKSIFTILVVLAISPFGFAQEINAPSDALEAAEEPPVSEEFAAALAYELPLYDCEPPDLIRGQSSPVSRQRFDRGWDNFNDCRSEYLAALGTDFRKIQATAAEARLESQQNTINEHLTSINDMAGEVTKDPYASEEADEEASGAESGDAGSQTMQSEGQPGPY